ncbi:MAG: thiamine-phosphate kinase [Candidatus Binatia bacterium]
MKLKELGEFGLIQKIQRTAPKGKDVRLGIGDDAACVKWRKGSFLVTSDLLTEGSHFDLRWTSFYGLGYKTLAVNLSDIAAMGGKPSYFLLSLGIPAHLKSENVQEFFRGLRALSSKSGTLLVGGDTSAADRLFVSICLIGYAPYGPIPRSGAKVGDDLYVTGTLGDSSLGLQFLKTRRHQANKAGISHLVSRHRFPVARVRAGIILARERFAKAMIDVSDGLMQDLGHICRASRVGAVVWEQTLPLSRPYRYLVGSKGATYALTGGEDYELLFCARVRARPQLERIRSRLGVKVTRIGTCVPASQGIKVIDSTGKTVALTAGGYDHFKH